MLKYSAVNEPVLARVPINARRILDVGCGTGELGVKIKQRQEAEVTGITFSSEEASEARCRLNEVVEADLETFEPGFLGCYDAVICSHILEHIRDPRRLLRSLAQCLAPEHGTLIVALPNVLFWRQRMQFALGRFRYCDGGGLMDRTHVAFYDAYSAKALLLESGFVLKRFDADGSFPQKGFRWILRPAGAGVLDRVMLRLFPGMFGFQFIMTARVSPICERER